MLNGLKIVGVCLTKIQDEVYTDLMQSLYKETENTDYRLLVFNSFLDFYENDSYGKGAASIYKAINFSILDMLIIAERCFYNKELIEELVEKAHSSNIPVLILNGEREGCFAVVKSYINTYSELIEHVITIHGARRINFIAGVKGEKDSEKRLRCCRDVMERHGLQLMDEDIAYCDYWDRPAIAAVNKWIDDKRIPQAIICANDTMAVAVCDTLAERGLRVPEDVIVTGFDGIESASYHTPRLTTCGEDIPALAKQCFDIIVRAVEKGDEPYTAKEKYNLLFSESCGCGCEDDNSYRSNADRLYNLVTAMKAHENTIYTWADRLLENTDLGDFGDTLDKNILPDSAVVLNSDFLIAARKNKITDPEHPFTDKMIVLSSCAEDYTSNSQEVFELQDMFPNFGESLKAANGITIFQSIYVEDKVCGYYIMKTRDLNSTSHRLHRFFRVMNLAFGTLVSRLEQEHLTSNIENMRFRDTITDLMNIKGVELEFEQRREEYRKKRLAVSVYNIPQYRYIYENFGLSDAEDALNLVSEALQLANPINTLLGRLTENEFVVINIEDPAVDIGAVITNAVAIFFSVTESYNSSLEKDYYVEVNCGCTVVEPGWEGDLSSFIKIASGEMYLNRLKTGNGPVLKEHKSYEDKYRMFDLLVEKNLFIYHFQPIVSARTGDIFAYEALMRTTANISMNPGEILEIATEYRRLYDIELATFWNVLRFVSEHPEEFADKRVFINTIPGHFLNDADYKDISETFHDLFRQCVIEITEQNDISDEELTKIKGLGGQDSACQLAIDDYGAGYSNIVNLLRYKPQVIKIDRFLISEIQNDANKQMFVKSVIDFAHSNNIMTIAEGVETLDEMNAVISYGVDLIQGYYTARPAAFPLQELPEKIREEIAEANGADFVEIMDRKKNGTDLSFNGLSGSGLGSGFGGFGKAFDDKFANISDESFKKASESLSSGDIVSFDGISDEDPDDPDFPSIMDIGKRDDGSSDEPDFPNIMDIGKRDDGSSDEPDFPSIMDIGKRDDGSSDEPDFPSIMDIGKRNNGSSDEPDFPDIMSMGKSDSSDK